MTKCPICKGRVVEEFIPHEFQYNSVTLSCLVPKLECEKCKQVLLGERVESYEIKAIGTYLQRKAP